ncbi:MAG: hypothetical protein AAFX50_10015 [Acidobacteriota bacterium]
MEPEWRTRVRSDLKHVDKQAAWIVGRLDQLEVFLVGEEAAGLPREDYELLQRQRGDMTASIQALMEYAAALDQRISRF